MLKPMLCEKIKESELPNYITPNWIAQKKEDGTRALLYFFIDGKVTLINRDLRDITYRYPESKEVEQELKQYGFSLILDVEIKSIKGYDYAHLRDSQESRVRISVLAKLYPIKFFVFDILQYDSELLTNKTLKERLEYLQKLQDSGLIEIAKSYNNPLELFEKVKEENGEGVILKDLNSIYEQQRSFKWLKCKFVKEKIVKLDGYEEHSAGVCCLSGKHRITCNIKPIAEKIKQKLDNKEDVFIEINFLDISKADMYRQPTFKKLIEV
jgi:DNA ligase 1